MRILLLLASLAAFPALADAPPAVVPENLDRLDPAVVELVRQQAAAVEKQPAAAEAHGELALVYEANNLWPQAEACLENAVRLAPGEVTWRFHLGLARRELGDFTGALELFKAVATERPDFAPAQQRLGEALLESGELAAAGAAFERLIELEKGAPHGYVGLGDVLLRQGDAENAAAALQRAIRLAPSYRAAHYLLGTAYLRLGKAEDAERELEQGAGGVLDYLPDPLTSRVQGYAMNLTARLNRAGEHLSAGRPDRAVAILEEVKRAHPDNVTVLNNLAIAYLRLHRLDAARASLETALTLDAARFSTYLNLTSWASRARQPEKALEFADAAVARAPEMAQTHYARAQALANLSRFDEALSSLARSLERDPQNPSAEAFSGDLSLHLRRYDAARGHYRRAVEIASGFLPAWVGLARANAALGQRVAAFDALGRARSIAPNHPMVTRLADELGKME